MLNAPLSLPDRTAADRRRRALLEVSDHILNEVEELRLREEKRVPETLRDSIEKLQVRVGRTEVPLSPATVRSAHDLVLALQHVLLSSNPRSGTPRSHPGRAPGQSEMRRLEGGGAWKLLTLPPPGGASPGEWLDLLDATVERALDRWSYAQHHATTAARERSGARQALKRSGLAWINYWDLAQEAARLREGLVRASS